MSFEHFKQALSLMADKKYAGASDRLDKLTSLLLSGEGPKTHGVTVSLTTLARLQTHECMKQENWEL